MKCLKILFVMPILVVMAISLRAKPAEKELVSPNEDDPATLIETYDTSTSKSQDLTSVRGTSRFLAENSLRVVMTCNKYPRVCWVKGSPGPYCCKKKCVDVTMDRLNCGMCGKKCEYYEICCKGECVNPSFDKKHCGNCKHKCKKGSSCVYGMCSYA